MRGLVEKLGRDTGDSRKVGLTSITVSSSKKKNPFPSLRNSSPSSSNWLGSYGAAPLPVVSSFLSIRNEVDQAPDRYMRITYEPELIKLRTQLSQLVDCDLDDLVIVPSATMGVNCALQSMTNEWKKRDKLLYFETTVYQACKMTLQSIVDSHPHLDLSLLPVKFSYPISHEKVIELTRETIREAEADGVTKVRLALIDGISSNPGVIVPWEKLVELFKEKDVVS